MCSLQRNLRREALPPHTTQRLPLLPGLLGLRVCCPPAHVAMSVCARRPACPALPLPPHADSKAIVDGNLKLILGLIWTLILHYSISMPMWEDEDDEDARKQTPKQRLLGWIQNKVPQLPITNFNRDWQDGKALGALVDNCAPGEWARGTRRTPEPRRRAGISW